MSSSPAFRKRVAAICERLPGAAVSDPWGGGHEAWKVGGKLFASIGAIDDGVTVKCPDIESAALLKEVGAAHHARYFHRSWVRLPEETDPDELAARIERSYDIVRAKLPLSVRKTLAERVAAD